MCVSVGDKWHFTRYVVSKFQQGTADGEEIPPSETEAVGRLFIRYGMAGVYYWVAQKRGHPPEFSPEKEQIQAVEALEELRKKLKEQGVYSKERLQ